MCGIIGIVSNQPIHLPIAKKMNDTMIHRGPNGYGYLSSAGNLNDHTVDHLLEHHAAPTMDAHFVLGHRRLAIHDTSEAGFQPMSYRNKYWVVFNGEIYNFIEIRHELEQHGYTFQSKTDTEVLLAAYDFYGVNCLEKFNGEWAFALLDTEKNKIFIARDRFGIKPLYVYFEKGLFLFASEIKALLAHPAVQSKPNLSYLNQYLKNGPQEYKRETAFDRIFHFDFATYFEGSLHELLDFNDTKLKRFYTLRPNLSQEEITPKKLEDYTQQYAQLLEDAVRLRMRSDVPFGVSLSGGLDSTSVTYLVNKIQKTEKTSPALQAFSSTYHSAGTTHCDESEKIDAISNQLAITSHKTEPCVKEIAEWHRRMIAVLDTPPDSTLMSSWYTAKLAAENKMTVILTGEGADEQLAGYDRYLAYFFCQLPIRKIFALTPNPHKRRDDKIRILKYDRYILLGLFLNGLSKIVGKKFAQFLYSLSGRKEKLFTPLNEKLKEDIFTNLVNLHHIDERVFMAFSIEQRSPFMDHRIVEFLMSIPASYKIANGWTKYLAKLAFQHTLPEAIVWNQTKLGWPIPEKHWFDNELKCWLEKTVFESDFLKRYYRSDLKNFLKLPIAKKIRLLNLAVWNDVYCNPLT